LTLRLKEELRKVPESSHQSLVLVEAVMDKNDSPVKLIVAGRAFTDTDYGARGPQSARAAHIEVPSPE
jgi:hypothetical protein